MIYNLMWLMMILVTYLFTNILFRNNNKIYVTLILIFLSIFVIFRDSSVGNDTIEYIRFFYNSHEITEVISDINVSRYEIGYVIINDLVKTLSDNYTILFFVTTMIYFITIGILISKYSKNPLLSITLFYGLGFYFISFNLIRQILALSFIMVGFMMKSNGKNVVSIIFVILATFIHETAIVVLPIFIFYRTIYKVLFHNKKRIYTYIVSTMFAILISVFFDNIQNVLFYIFPRYQSYFFSIYSEGTIRLASVLMYTFLLVLVFVSSVFNKHYRNSYKSTDILNFSEVFLYFALMTLFVSFNLNLLDRLVYYFSFPILIFYPNVIRTYKNRHLITLGTIILLCIYISTIVLFRPEWSGIFPYNIK
jgi:hypothetical protein